MELKEFIGCAHSLIEAKEKRKVTRDQMAERLGVGYRTYLEYRRGTNAPLAMKALLNLLMMLDDQEVLRVIHEWRDSSKVSTTQIKTVLTMQESRD